MILLLFACLLAVSATGAIAAQVSMKVGDKSDIFIEVSTILEEVTKIEQIRPRGWEKWTPKKGDHFIAEYLRSDAEWHYYRALRVECCTGVCRNRLRGEFRIKRRVTELRERVITQVGLPVRFRVEFEELPPLPPAEVGPPPPTHRPGPLLGAAEGNNRPGFAPERRAVSIQHGFWQRRIRVTAIGGNAAASASASASAAAAASAGDAPPPPNAPVDAAGAGATAPPRP